MSVLMPDKVSVRGPARFVQGDTRTQIVTFTVPRYSDGVDLSKLGWSIHIKNAAGTKWFEAPAENPDVRSDKITIKWLVRGDTTKTAGDLTFSLRGAGNDAAGNAMRWCSGDEIRPVCAAQESSSTSNNETAVTAVELLLQMVQTELPAVIAAKEDTIKATASANAAAALADAAAKNAASAATAATTARDAANTAAARASSAAESVEAVVINANDAADEASAAAVDANEAKAAADAAAGSANAAAGRLEEGLSTVREALSAMIKAEDNRVAAETQRVGKENLRDNAETRRANAETKREEAESNRIATFAEAHAASVAATSAANQAAESARGAAEAAYSVANLAADPLVLVEKSQPACIWPEAGKLLHPVITMLPMQGGSGDPSPENVRTISGRTAVMVTRCGKNLLPFPDERMSNTVNGITYTINDDGSITADGTPTNAATHSNIALYFSTQGNPTSRFALKAGRYKLVCEGSKDTSSLYTVLYEQIDSGTNNLVISSRRKDYVEFTTDRDSVDYNLMISCQRGYAPSDETLKIMIVPADATTDYEPYRGDAYSISLGQTVYGGTLDVNTGLLTVDRAVLTMDGVTSGAMLTGASTVRPNFYYAANALRYVALLPAANNVVADIVSSHFKAVSWDALAHHSTFDEIAMFEGGHVGFAYDGTIEAANAWLAAQKSAGTPVQVCYRLAEPVTVQLSPAYIAALEGLNTVFSSGEGMELTYNKSLVREREELLVRISALEAALLNNV